MSHHIDVEDHDKGLGHVVPHRVYIKVLAALLCLTVLTVVAAKLPALDFGNWNVAVAMIIASTKALLVALFFMHLKYENPVTWLYALFPILLLALLIGGVFLDNPLRYVP